MNTEDKAKQLCREFENATILGSPLSRGSVAFQASIEMAEWKNEQFKNIINNTLSWFVDGGILVEMQRDAMHTFADKLIEVLNNS